MANLWDQRRPDSSDGADVSERDSLKMIPYWSIVLAIAMFVGWQLFSYYSAPHRHSPMHLLTDYVTGTVLASYVLLVGYVSRDVKLRKMPAKLWMLIVVVMPGGIGGVVYFLLRQPVLIRCPHCSTELTAGVHFCPQCRFQVAPVCGQCYRGVQTTDAYCPQCGHNIAEDGGPARLHAFSDN
jgi:hypothetical protein